MRREQKQVFVLHLGSRQSIGPDDLRVMWATACESLDVRVSRRMLNAGGSSNRPCYGLWVGTAFNRIPAEQRLRAMLEARGYLFTLTNTAL